MPMSSTAQGRLVAHPDISLVLRGTDMKGLAQVAAALAPQGVQGSPVEATNLAGVSVLSAHATIPALNWLVFVEVPTLEAQQPVIDAGLRALALLVLGLLIAGLPVRCWRGAWWCRSGRCRPAPSASAVANSAIGSRSRPATSWNRSPTSSIAPPRRLQESYGISNRESRTAPPSCANRWSSRPRRPKS